MPEGTAPDLRFDHAVIAVADLEQAMSDYEALGFTVRFGGEHPGRRTHNALIYFADGNYLELIAERPGLPPTDDPREAWVRDAVREGRALLTYALRSADLELTIARCAGRGLKLDGPHDGARVRPDGARVAWRSAAAASVNLPFLIEDISARELRISDAPEDTEHANGARGVKRVVLLTAEVARIVSEYEPFARAGATPDNTGAHFSLGKTAITIRLPANAHERAALGEAPALPYALDLVGSAARELDVGKSGFPLALVP